MRLTKKKAIEISIELWTWLAETGEEKDEWPGWEECGHMSCYCAFCEYCNRHPEKDTDSCSTCPYYEKFGPCQADDENLTPYDKWEEAKTEVLRKKYASQFLVQLKELK